MLSDAIDIGLLFVEFDDSDEASQKEYITKTWAIHSVVDQTKQSKVSNE